MEQCNFRTIDLIYVPLVPFNYRSLTQNTPNKVKKNYGDIKTVILNSVVFKYFFVDK